MNPGLKKTVTALNRFPLNKDYQKIFVIALTYFLAHGIAFFFPDSEKVIMLVWPAGGIGLAAFLLNPKRLWPQLTIAFYIAGISADWFLAGRSLLTGFGYMTGNMVESIGCAWLILYVSKDFKKFTRIKEVFALFAGTLFINAISSCIGAGTSVLTRDARFMEAWQSWYISDGLGVFLLGPLIVVWISGTKEFIADFQIKKIAEGLALIFVWSSVAFLIFSNQSITSYLGLHPYILVALLAWPALRFGQHGVTLTLIVLFAIAIFSPSITIGPSPWTDEHVRFTHRILELQMFLGFLALVGYLMAAGYSSSKQIEKTLLKSEEKYRISIETAMDGFWLANEEGKLLQVNEAYCRMTGYSKSELLTMRISDLDISENDSDTAVHIQRIKLLGEDRFESKHRCKDGSIKDFYVSVQYQPIDGGRCIAFLHDITERMSIHEKLRESENRFSLFMDHLPALVFIKDSESRALYVNNSMDVALGASKWIGLKPTEVFDSETAARIIKDDNDSKLCGSEKIEESFPNLDGQIHHYETQKFLIPRPGLDPLLGGIAIDITDRKNAMEALKESEEKFRLLFENSPLGISITSTDGKIVNLNNAMVNLLGSPSIEISKQINVLTFPNLVQNGYAEEFKKCVIEKKIIVKEMNYYSKWGKELIISVYFVPMLDADGNAAQVYTLVEDITKRKMVEQELLEYRNHLEELVKVRTNEWDAANEELQIQIKKQLEYELMLQESLEKEKELNEMKSRFISTTSHEFRTPLTSLLSSAELLQKYGTKWNDDKRDEHFVRIKHSIKYLTKLLDDILTISRSETGNISFNPGIFDLIKLAEECVSDLKLAMTNMHQVKVKYLVTQREYWLDYQLMQFIFNNLLSNAIKYSPNGGCIEFTISSDEKELKIEVRDEGIGISKEETEKIFESFYRSKSVENIKGNGLGLAIVKRAVDIHGGEITIESELGKGTAFTITVPIRENTNKI